MAIFRFGVLDTGALIWREGNYERSVPMADLSLSEIARQARELQLLSVWIVPGSFYARSWRALLAAWQPRGKHFILRATTADDSDPVGVSLNFGWQDEMFILNTETEPRWPWYRETSATRIIDAIQVTQTALDFPLGYTPSGTGLQLVRQLSRADWLKPLAAIDGNNKSQPFTRGVSDIRWCRPLTEAERRMRFVHVFDANSAYIAAASNCNLPCGEPEPDRSISEPMAGGYYRARVFASPDVVYNGVSYPSPLYPYVVSGHQEGYWYSPQLIEARALGWNVDLLDGYYWPGMHRVLGKWGHAMWGARVLARHDRLAAAAIKAMAVGAIGRLSNQLPQWRGFIMSEVYRRQVNKNQQLAALGIQPVAHHVDAIYIVSDCADPTKVAPKLIERSDSLGGYKHVYTVAIDSDIISAGAAPSPQFHEVIAPARKEVLVDG